MIWATTATAKNCFKESSLIRRSFDRRETGSKSSNSRIKSQSSNDDDDDDDDDDDANDDDDDGPSNLIQFGWSLLSLSLYPSLLLSSLLYIPWSVSLSVTSTYQWSVCISLSLSHIQCNSPLPTFAILSLSHKHTPTFCLLLQFAFLSVSFVTLSSLLTSPSALNHCVCITRPVCQIRVKN